MRALVIAAVLVAAGCEGSGTPRAPKQDHQLTDYSSVMVWHDDVRHVTCWIFYGNKAGGIHCMPDALLEVGP